MKELDEVVELAVDVSLDGDDVPAVLQHNVTTGCRNCTAARRGGASWRHQAVDGARISSDHRLDGRTGCRELHGGAVCYTTSGLEGGAGF